MFRYIRDKYREDTPRALTQGSGTARVCSSPRCFLQGRGHEGFAIIIIIMIANIINTIIIVIGDFKALCYEISFSCFSLLSRSHSGSSVLSGHRRRPNRRRPEGDDRQVFARRVEEKRQRCLADSFHFDHRFEALVGCACSRIAGGSKRG